MPTAAGARTQTRGFSERVNRSLSRGSRDCAFRDPSGNLLRIQEPRRAVRWTRDARSQQRKEQA